MIQKKSKIPKKNRGKTMMAFFAEGRLLQSRFAKVDAIAAQVQLKGGPGSAPVGLRFFGVPILWINIQIK